MRNKMMYLVLISLVLTYLLLPSDSLGSYMDYYFVTQWGTYGGGSGQFNQPYGIAVDSSGNVYVVDHNNNRIQKFTSEGVFITAWGSFSLPYDVAVDYEGNVYVADTGNRRIQKFTSEGLFLTQWGSANLEPSSVAISESGSVYVADTWNHRVYKFTSDGTLITFWGGYGTGDGKFNYPYGIALDSSENVYIADLENDRVQKFTSEGVFLTKWGTHGFNDGQFLDPLGLAVDGSGNIYVVDNSNYPAHPGYIQKFTSDGTFLTRWGTYGSGEGQFNLPWDIAVDSLGNVYVSDKKNHRIQKFAPIPEPSTILLLTTGLVGIGAYCFRRRKRNSTR